MTLLIIDFFWRIDHNIGSLGTLEQFSIKWNSHASQKSMGLTGIFMYYYSWSCEYLGLGPKSHWARTWDSEPWLYTFITPNKISSFLIYSNTWSTLKFSQFPPKCHLQLMCSNHNPTKSTCCICFILHKSLII